MEPLDFLIATCATWFVSYVLTSLEGPFHLLKGLRRGIGGPLNCIYCIAPYVALVMFLGLSEFSSIVEILGIAGGSLLLRAHTGAGTW